MRIRNCARLVGVVLILASIWGCSSKETIKTHQAVNFEELEDKLKVTVKPREIEIYVNRLAAAADNNVLPAQKALGLLFYNGSNKLLGKDFRYALKYLEKSAAKGDIESQYLVGSIYADGRGVRRDYTAAFNYFKNAAGRGYGPAQEKLGYFFQSGLGTKRNAEKSAYWYLAAAENGEEVAQERVSSAFSAGKGVARDNVQAYKWLSLANRAKPSELNRIFLQDLARSMSSSEIKVARKAVHNWLEKHDIDD